VPEPISTGAAILGAGALGAGAGIYGASRAASAQSRAADTAARTQEDMFNRTVELQEPFRLAGLSAQNRMLTLLGLPGGQTDAADFGRYDRDFGMADFEADPGYGFRMSEGMKAVERSAAARGGLLSGSTLRGIQRFGQDLASNEYTNAFNRYQISRNARLNPLQSLSGGGQSSTNLLSNAAMSTGQGMANTLMAGGQARASGYVGGVNALTGALQSAVPNYMMARYMFPGSQPSSAGG
jgi:hypothetical protein